MFEQLFTDPTFIAMILLTIVGTAVIVVGLFIGVIEALTDSKNGND